VSGKCNVCTDGEPIVEVLDKLEGGMSMAMARQHVSELTLYLMKKHIDMTRGSIKASSP